MIPVQSSSSLTGVPDDIRHPTPRNTHIENPNPTTLCSPSQAPVQEASDLNSPSSHTSHPLVRLQEPRDLRDKRSAQDKNTNNNTHTTQHHPHLPTKIQYSTLAKHKRGRSRQRRRIDGKDIRRVTIRKKGQVCIRTRCWNSLLKEGVLEVAIRCRSSVQC